MERFGWIKICQVAHTQSHHGLGCQNRDRAQTLLGTTEGSSANGNIAHVLKNGASGLELPAPKQWIWGLMPLLPCVLTAARTGRMNRERDQTSVFQD